MPDISPQGNSKGVLTAEFIPLAVPGSQKNQPGLW